MGLVSKIALDKPILQNMKIKMSEDEIYNIDYNYLYNDDKSNKLEKRGRFIICLVHTI